MTIIPQEPAPAKIEMRLICDVPTDASLDDEIVLSDVSGNELFAARIEQLHPDFSNTLIMRIKMFSESFVAEALDKLFNQGRSNFQKSDYGR